MADVTLMGARYSDVPAVVLPKTGGGEAVFLDAETVRGVNLMINTLVPSAVAAERPRLAGQTANTTVRSAASTTTATHGIRVGTADTTNPYVTFGATGTSSANLNGLEAGDTYTLSFDCDAKMFSGSPAAGTTYELQAILYDNSASASALAVSQRGTIHVYSSADTSDRGVLVEDLRCEFTFTVPANATKLYLTVRPSVTTTGLFAAGDYIELRNIKLEAGAYATAWTPAPEDYA